MGCGEGANPEFLISLAIVYPDDLSGCVGLNNNVVTNTELDWDGSDEFDVCLVVAWAVKGGRCKFLKANQWLAVVWKTWS